MATPNYFSKLPNLKYAQSVNKAGHVNYITTKDFFRLLKPKDDIFKEDTIYTTYVVKDGERPDQISYEQYGDEQYYWIILQINEIIDFYNEWPLSNKELEEYCKKKYGSLEGMNKISHYETVETIDSNGNNVLPGGLTVPQDFIYYYPAYPGSDVTLSSLPTEVTFYAQEKRLNEKKSEIFILKERYISDYVREVKQFGFRSQQQDFSQISISDTL